MWSAAGSPLFFFIMGAQTLETAAVTVGTTATALALTSTNSRHVIIRNMDASATVYVGNSAVTTGTGFPIGPLETLTLPVGEGIYGRVATGTVAVRVLRARG